MNATARWPAAVFEAPLLRDLDPAARQRLCAAGRLHTLAPDRLVFEAGAPGDGFFVIARGLVELRSADGVRRLAAGETFGEEASLGLPRRSRAVATTEAVVAEVPIGVFHRGVARVQREALWDRELRILRRTATRDLLQRSVLGGLDAEPLDHLLDAARHEQHARGDTVFELGAAATEAILVADGLLALERPQADAEGTTAVHAYLSPGDLLLPDDARHTTRAVAMGSTRLVVLPLAVLAPVLRHDPEVDARVRARARQRRDAQARAVGRATGHATRHAFHDLYRLQVARSLLVIDTETCVRCGHCAWSCAQVHGTSRLIRRGEHVVARVRASPEPRSLLLPQACQHCTDPVCMTDCPTGAIERGSAGEVFITEALCTGCGNCAKACPWENIRLAPRASGVASDGLGPDAPGLSAQVAIKCDLCRDHDAPACVRACPTESIVRIDPKRDLVEVAEVLTERRHDDHDEDPQIRTRPAFPSRRRLGSIVFGSVLAAALGLVAYALRNHGAGVWAPHRGPGLVAGWIAATALIGLLAHAIPKRCVRGWLRRRRRASALEAPRSLVRPLVGVHVVLGVVGLSAAVVHAGPRLSSGVAGSLYLTWLMVCGLGLWGALAYRILPAALGRLERAGTLPEEASGQGEALVDRMHRELSGRSPLVKTVADRVLLPYARAPWGPLALILARRSLAREQAHLRARIDAVLQGRGADALRGLDALVRTAVEQRALPSRRLLHALLRGWLLPHVMLTGIVVVLVLVHVIAMGVA